MDIEKQEKLDWFLILIVALQVILGLFLINSVTLPKAELLSNNSFSNLHRYIGWLGVSLVSAIILVRFWSTDFVRKHINALLIMAFVLIFLTLIPSVGETINGSSSWLSIGSVMLYPQPISIFLLGLFVSNLMANEFNNNVLQTKPTLMLVAVTAVFILINILQPDISAALTLLGLILFLCCITGWYKFAIISVVGAVLLAFVSLIFSPYRMGRILTLFEDPFAHRFDTGYQLVLSLSSIGGGDIWGVGYGEGEGVIKAHLPNVEGGFIYAALVEELGAVGGLIALILAALICLRCFTIAYKLLTNQKKFEGLFVCFITFWIGLLSVLNVSATLGLLPISNNPFPFLSTSGVHLFVFILSIALVLKFDLELRETQGLIVLKPIKPMLLVVLLSFGSLGFIVTSKAIFDSELDKEYVTYQQAFKPESLKRVEPFKTSDFHR